VEIKEDERKSLDYVVVIVGYVMTWFIM